MANVSTNMMIWVDAKLANELPLSKEFEPVYAWDNAARTFTDQQERDDKGNLVWQAEALLQTGYGRQTTPVKVRIAAAQRPDVHPDPMKLLAALGAEMPVAARPPAAAPAMRKA